MGEFHNGMISKFLVFFPKTPPINGTLVSLVVSGRNDSAIFF